MSTTVRFDPSGPYEVEESDVVYARPAGQELLARVYRPRGEPATPLVGLVDAHGGAWNRFDRTIGGHHGRGLAAAGVVIASLDFRQGPNHKHPTASADVAAGVRWMRAPARRPGGDPRRGGLVGQAGGGHPALRGSVGRGIEARALPPVWLAHAEHDDNVPAEITEAFVGAYGKAGGRLERVYFPGARHGFMQQAGADTDKCIALMRDFIGRS